MTGGGGGGVMTQGPVLLLPSGALQALGARVREMGTFPHGES